MDLETSPDRHDKSHYFALSPWRREIIQRQQESENVNTQEIPQLTHNPILHTSFEDAIAELNTYIDTQHQALQDVETRFKQRYVLFVSTPTEEHLQKVKTHLRGLSVETNIVVLYPGDKYTKWGEWSNNTPKVFTIE